MIIGAKVISVSHIYMYVQYMHIYIHELVPQLIMCRSEFLQTSFASQAASLMEPPTI